MVEIKQLLEGVTHILQATSSVACLPIQQSWLEDLSKIKTSKELIEWLIKFEWQVTEDIRKYLTEIDPTKCLTAQSNIPGLEITVLHKINLLDKLLANVRGYLNGHALDLLKDIRENANLKGLYDMVEAIYNRIYLPGESSSAGIEKFQSIKNYLLLILLETVVQIYQHKESGQSNQAGNLELDEKFKNLEDFIRQLYTALNPQNSSVGFHIQLKLVFEPGQQQAGTKGGGSETNPTSRGERFNEGMRNDYEALLNRLKTHGIKLPDQSDNAAPISPDDYAYLISINSGENFSEASKITVNILGTSNEFSDIEKFSAQLGRGAIFIEPDFQALTPGSPMRAQILYHPNKIMWLHEFLHIIANAKGESRRTVVENYSSKAVDTKQIPLLNAYYIGSIRGRDGPSAEEFCITIGLNMSEKVLAESLGFNHTRGIYSGVYLSMANVELDMELKAKDGSTKIPETPVQLLNNQLERGKKLPTREDALSAAAANRRAEQKSFWTSVKQLKF